MKILHMEYGGLVIYHMKLEQGYFHVPSIDTEEGLHQSRGDLLERSCNDGPGYRQQQGQTA